MIKNLILILAAFILGAIPTGYILGLLHGVDLRKHGSGNIGATNAKRVLGSKAGIITLLLDALKGVCATLLPFVVNNQIDALSLSDFRMLCGLLAIIGHCYSPFLKFNGGKGVATSLGVFLSIAPVVALIAILVFALTLLISGFVSLGSLLSALSLPIMMFFLFRDNFSLLTIALTIAATFLVIFRHQANIKRLLKGEEPRFRRQTATDRS